MSYRIKFCGKTFFKNRAGKSSLFFHYLSYSISGRLGFLFFLGSALTLIFGFPLGYFPATAFWGPVIGCFFSFNFAVFGYIYLNHVDQTLIYKEQHWSLDRQQFHIQWGEREVHHLWSDLDRIKISDRFIFLLQGSKMWVLPRMALPPENRNEIEKFLLSLHK